MDNKVNFVFEKTKFKATKLSKNEIILTLKEYWNIKNHQQFTTREFDSWRNKPISSDSIIRIFGSWAKALQAAGIKPKMTMKRDVNEMVETFKKCWIENKGEPTKRQLENYLNKTASPYTWKSYRNYFGGLGRLAQRIIDYQNGKISEQQLYLRHITKKKRATISLKLRYKVLKRDNERCVKCGASPKADPTIKLEIDHIIPASKGGSDSLDNLQTLCSLCNQGKKDQED